MHEPASTPPGAPAAAAGLRARLHARLEREGRYSRWVLLSALAGMFATTFPVTILTISLAGIAEEFGASVTTLAWVITAPMLCSAVALPLLGKLGDMFGHRRVFLLGFVAATATAFATAWAWSALSLIGLRTLAAIVGGATQPTSMALIFSVYPPEERVRAMGWWSMTTAAAPALGLIAGGPLVDWLGWRIVFVLQGVVSLGALALAALILRETPRQRVRFDVLGVVALSVAVAGLMFGLSRATQVPLGDPTLWGPVVVGTLALFAFVRIEGRVAEPLLDLAFFRERNFGFPMVAGAFMGAAYMGAFVLAPLVLFGLFGFGVAQAAGFMLIRTLTLTVISPFGGRLGLAIGERGAAVTGCVVMAFALAVICVGTYQESLAVFGVGLVLQGAGHGLSLPSLNSAVASAVPEANLGIASATNRLVVQVGTAFGITAMTLAYAGLDTGEGLGRAFALGTGFAVLSLLAAGAMAPRPALESRRAPA